MDGPLKLFVYAVAAVALLWVFYTFIGQYLFAPDPADVIAKSLSAAETWLGTGVSNEILFKPGNGFTSETFNGRARNVIFQCNGAQFCCPTGETCGLDIEWDSKRAEFKSNRVITATARCDLSYGIFTCTVYLGEKPAQMKIKSTAVPMEADGTSSRVIVTLLNTGEKDIEQCAIETKAFLQYKEGDQQMERFVGSASETLNAGRIRAGGEIEKEIAFNVKESGDYRIVVRASGLDAGFDENTVAVRAKVKTRCMMASCGNQQMMGEKCVKRCTCTDCLFGAECLRELKAQGAQGLAMPEGIKLDELETEIMGSNIVDFTLQPWFCR